MNSATQTGRRRRRLRDRIIDREGTDNDRLTCRFEIQNHLLLIDDDLRETALALGNIEGFLSRTLAMLERRDLTRSELELLATDPDIEENVASLDETLASLRRRIRHIAGNLR